MIERAGVAKATLYRHFRSKDDLVLAFLEQREQVWTREWVEAEARRRGQTPEEQLLAVFDLFDEWFQQDDFEGCSFVNVLLEFGGGSDHPLGRASAAHLDKHPLDRAHARRGGGPPRRRLVRPLLAHSDEGIDRPGRRRRPPGGETSQVAGSAPHRAAPVVLRHLRTFAAEVLRRRNTSLRDRRLHGVYKPCRGRGGAFPSLRGFSNRRSCASS